MTEQASQTPAAEPAESTTAPRSKTSNRLQRLRPALPWLGLVVLNLCFVLPAVMPILRKAPLAVFHPSGDLLALLTIAAFSLWVPGGVWIRRIALVVGFVLWIYMWDCLIARSILHEDPLLYDQLFLLHHLALLITDVVDWTKGLMALAAVGGVVLLVWLSKLLLRRLQIVVSPEQRKRTLMIGLAVWMIAIGGTLWGRGKPPKSQVVHWTTPSFVGNVSASVQLYRHIENVQKTSPYAAYEGIELTRRPDFNLFLVESYGRLLANHPESASRWERRMKATDVRLRRDGWYTVSGFSTAPVSGGRSWLAEATILMGMVVKYESMFHHLVEDIDEFPHFVGFLERNGYETILLGPKDRARPGLPIINHYRYDQYVHHDMLQYTGEMIGWGGIPDQYTLGFAHENFFSKVEGPMFVNFHMVSSHAPWKAIPPVVEDWRDLATGDRQGEAFQFAGEDNPLLSAKRFNRHEPRYTYMGQLDSFKLESFEAACYYDLTILEKYLTELEDDRDRIVIIMGDHQPPVISQDNADYDVPVHVLARDPALLEGFREQGFVDGWFINSGRDATVRHEALFSLFVRTLTLCCSETEAPEVRQQGVPL